jgi:hypothetical protein
MKRLRLILNKEANITGSLSLCRTAPELTLVSVGLLMYYGIFRVRLSNGSTQQGHSIALVSPSFEALRPRHTHFHVMKKKQQNPPNSSTIAPGEVKANRLARVIKEQQQWESRAPRLLARLLKYQEENPGSGNDEEDGEFS